MLFRSKIQKKAEKKEKELRTSIKSEENIKSEAANFVGSAQTEGKEPKKRTTVRSLKKVSNLEHVESKLYQIMKSTANPRNKNKELAVSLNRLSSLGRISLSPRYLGSPMSPIHKKLSVNQRELERKQAQIQLQKKHRNLIPLTSSHQEQELIQNDNQRHFKSVHEIMSSQQASNIKKTVGGLEGPYETPTTKTSVSIQGQMAQKSKSSLDFSSGKRPFILPAPLSLEPVHRTSKNPNEHTNLHYSNTPTLNMNHVSTTPISLHTRSTAATSKLPFCFNTPPPIPHLQNQNKTNTNFIENSETKSSYHSSLLRKPNTSNTSNPSPNQQKLVKAKYADYFPDAKFNNCVNYNNMGGLQNGNRLTQTQKLKQHEGLVDLKKNGGNLNFNGGLGNGFESKGGNSAQFLPASFFVHKKCNNNNKGMRKYLNDLMVSNDKLKNNSKNCVHQAYFFKNSIASNHNLFQ